MGPLLAFRTPGGHVLYGIIDIGSNTIRLTIYEVDEKARTFSTFFKLKTMAGLVSYIDGKTGLMSEKGIEKLLDCLDGYLRCASHFKEMHDPFAFATAGVRNARNRDEILARVKDRCGLVVDLVSGREEAELGYVGAMYQSHLKKGVQIDVGGGSVEVTTFSRGEIIEATSIPYGSLSLFDACVHDLLPTPAESDQIRGLIRPALQSVPAFEGFTCEVASGVGGSVRAARSLRDAWVVDSARDKEVTTAQISLILERVAYDSRQATRDILRVAPERVHTCIPGLLVVQTVMDQFGATRLETHDFGVREGYLLAHVFNVRPKGKK